MSTGRALKSMHVTVIIYVDLAPAFVFGAVRMHIAAAEFAAGRPRLGQLAAVQAKLDFTSADLIAARVRHFPVAHPETQRAVSASGADRRPFRSPKRARRNHRGHPTHPPHSAHEDILGNLVFYGKARHAQ